MIYFPFFNKEIILIADTIGPVFETLILLALLLVHRAQASASLASFLTKDNILKLPSVKWNAKQIANNKNLKTLYAQVAISETISFEYNNIKDMDKDQAAAYLKELADKLASEPKPKNARIIPLAALNEGNINLHRHGKIAQYIGILQSKPIYEANTILKGVAIANIQPSQLITITLETLEKMEISPIPEDSVWVQILQNSPEGDSNSSVEALKALSKSELSNEVIVFDDAIGIGTQDNLLPLEIIMNVSRPITDITSAPTLSEAQQNNIFLVEASKQQQRLVEERTKRVSAKTTKPRISKKETPTPKQHTPSKASIKRAPSKKKASD